MRILTESGGVDARKWNTVEDMAAYLRRFRVKVVLNSGSSDDSFGSYVLQTSATEDADVDVAVGLAWSPGTFEPQILVVERDTDELIVVGFDTEVVGLSRKTLQVAFRIELKTYFRSLSYLKGIGILVFEEIGVSLFSLEGARAWVILKDVITAIRLDRDELCLSFMDSGPIRIDVRTGATTSPENLDSNDNQAE